MLERGRWQLLEKEKHTRGGRQTRWTLYTNEGKTRTPWRALRAGRQRLAIRSWQPAGNQPATSRRVHHRFAAPPPSPTYPEGRDPPRAASVGAAFTCRCPLVPEKSDRAPSSSASKLAYHIYHIVHIRRFGRRYGRSIGWEGRRGWLTDVQGRPGPEASR